MKKRKHILLYLDISRSSHGGPTFPVILVKGIFNRDDRCIGDELLVQVSQLVRGQPFVGIGVRVLEVQVVLALFVELGGGNVHADLDLASVAGLLNGILAKLKKIKV